MSLLARCVCVPVRGAASHKAMIGPILKLGNVCRWCPCTSIFCIGAWVHTWHHHLLAHTLYAKHSPRAAVRAAWALHALRLRLPDHSHALLVQVGGSKLVLGDWMVGGCDYRGRTD
eukprot:1138382-Pelagomonas_calceolata.AAC.13